VNQAKVTLLDQVEKRQSAIEITPRNFHHEPQVAFYHALPRRLIALQCAPREVLFFIRSQEWRDANLAKIESRWIDRMRPKLVVMTLTHSTPSVTQRAPH
jgi:hypothetical protein